MSLNVESIRCYQLKGEEVMDGGDVAFKGEYWPAFLGDTPTNCPLRLKREIQIADFIACAACEHAIIKFAVE